MPTITFILKDGRRQTIDAEIGDNIMQVATFNNIPGIEGACGGFCSCATCHVYVESAHPLPAIAEDEEIMLKGTAAERNPKTSRLTCQIIMTDALDGLLLRIPERQ